MALTLMRTTKGLSMCRGVGCQLIPKMTPALATVVPRKSFILTSRHNKRLYGPEEQHEKVDDVHHWTNERYIAVALLPIIPTALAFPHPVLDTLLCSTMVLHVHWRLSGMAEDYIHGQILPRIAQPTVLILSIVALGGLCYFNYTDIGFANAVRMLYTQL